MAAIFCPERYGIIEASTKTGKTHGCIAWIIERCIALGGNKNHWWIAPVYPQSSIAYRRAKRALKPYIDAGLVRANDSDLFIEIKEAGTIWFKSADKPDNLYGEDVYSVVIDEASRCKLETWAAVRSVITASGGFVRIIGNVRGKKNFHYELARKAEQGGNGWHYSKLTILDAVEAGIVPESEVEDARNLLPPDVFNELYMAIPSDTGTNPFGIKAIEECTIKDLAGGIPVVYGWDLAKSQDWTVGIGLDSFKSQNAFHRFQKPWRDTISDILVLTAGTPSLVDSTGVGDPVLEILQTNRDNFEGFVFTFQSKQQLMERLGIAISQRDVQFTQSVANELKDMEYEYTKLGVRYNVPEGFTDDQIMALALAVKHHGEARSNKKWFDFSKKRGRWL